MIRQFKNRREAGQLLAARLARYANRADVIVLALPRGGVPVAFEVAMLLNLPLDIFLVRKLGVPGFEELAIGAVASGGIRYLNQVLIRELELGNAEVDQITANACQELERREQLFRGDRPPLQVHWRTVIVIDDGLATGATVRAAVRSLHRISPARLVVAVPVAPQETIRDLETEVDEVVCLLMPEDLQAISLWYKEFPQLTDNEVRTLLARAENGPAVPLREFTTA